MTDHPIPRATYRLQLHGGFRFADAAELAPYLASLGISHAYLSPILMAQPGSTHGYDTVDHTRINPELGTLDEFRLMAGAFQRNGIGIILDIVPNHMGIGGSDNRLWLNVLEHGEASSYAGWFDIDWHPAEPSLDGKVLVPFLDRSYGEALADGILNLQLDDSGAAAVWLPGGRKLPLARGTYDEVNRDTVDRFNIGSGRLALDAIIARQHWRVAKGNVANDDINYRRFFIISELAGIRIERPEVFDHVHRLAFELIGEGLVDGLRIDHIDGLFDPKAYCIRLRAQSPRPIYIVVEKILADGEKLRADWAIDGTTGYDFASLVTPLLVDPRSEATLTRFYKEFTGAKDSPSAIELETKRRVMARELAAELDALSFRFATLARSNLATRDLTRSALKRGLEAFIAAMPTYRTYVDLNGSSDADKSVVAATIESLKANNGTVDGDVIGFIERVMLDPKATGNRDAAVGLAMRVQQFTGPVMAKGLEDTALYRFNRLIALNDVGERPEPFSRQVAEFHAANIERARLSPHSMLATSSHDSKRGEETRARIAALSGHAEAWIAAVPEWMEILRRQGAPEIAPDDAYAFFQTLFGAWPGSEGSAFTDRVVAAMRKSLREARLRSDWSNPDSAYEAEVEAFIRVALNDRPNGFLDAFLHFEEEIGGDGAINGLIEATLKLTVPGVPDIYQGAELWEQSLVDPDNRRPVDFDLRSRLLCENEAVGPGSLMTRWRDGAVKQSLIARLLRFRRLHPLLFADGTYEPMEGPALDAASICAFKRRYRDEVLLVAVKLYPWRKGTAEFEGFEESPDGTLLDVLSGELTEKATLDPSVPIGVFARVDRAGTGDGG